MTETQRDYLGDGVYASFDGYQIWLATEREEGWHKIALEPPVMDALMAYAERVWPKVVKDALEERGR